MRVGTVLVVLATAAVFVGCGGASEDASSTDRRPSPAKEWRVTLDSVDGPENVGVLMALYRGFFKDAGLDVWAGSPLEPNRPASYVAKGTDDFGLLQMPQLIIAREKGMPLVAIESLVPHPTATVMWLKRSKIHNVADLKGKTIAIPGAPFQQRLFEAVLARAGVARGEVRVKKVGYNLVGALIHGKVDAIFGGSRSIEGIKLEARGEKPVVTSIQGLGVPDYEELVLVARNELVQKDPQVVRNFVAAVERGAAAAIEDPSAAVDAVVRGLEANPPPNRGVMEAQMKATLPLLSQAGRIDPARAQRLIRWMHEEGLIEKEPHASELLTNDFVRTPGS